MKLSREQVARKTELTDEIAEKFSDLQNALMQYNQVLDDARSFRDEVVENIQEYIDNKSESWQESDAGSKYDEWRSEWEDIDLEEVDEPDEIDFDSLTDGP